MSEPWKAYSEPLPGPLDTSHCLQIARNTARAQIAAPRSDKRQQWGHFFMVWKRPSVSGGDDISTNWKSVFMPAQTHRNPTRENTNRRNKDLRVAATLDALFRRQLAACTHAHVSHKRRAHLRSTPRSGESARRQAQACTGNDGEKSRGVALTGRGRASTS